MFLFADLAANFDLHVVLWGLAEENSLMVPQKVKCTIVTWPSSSTPKYTPKRNERKYSKQGCMWVSRAASFQNVVTTLNVHQWTSTHKLHCVHTVECWLVVKSSTDAWDNVNEQWRSHVVWVPLYETYRLDKPFTGTERTLVVPWGREGEWKVAA